MRAIIYIFVFLYSSSAFAAEPKITETENGFVVEYTGTPEEKKPDISRNTLTPSESEDFKREISESIKRLKNKVAEAEQQIQEHQNTSRLENDIKVSSIHSLETERAYNYVTYSIKADIDNKGDRGQVYVKLIGKNRDGHQIHYVYLTGTLERRESRTLTTTAMLSYQQAMDVREWVVDSVKKYK